MGVPPVTTAVTDPSFIPHEGFVITGYILKASGSLMDNLMNAAMSPDVAVRKYVRQIKKDQLYIFDSQGPKDILALKGKDMKEYEEFLLNYQNMQAKGIREQFEKYGLNFDDYI